MSLRRWSAAAVLAGASWAGTRRYLARRREIDFDGRVVLITGGSRGLGLELARTFADEGARLALLARDPDELERACEELAGRGADVRAWSCDLKDPEMVRETVTQIAGVYGRIDVLVHDAGVIAAGPLPHMTEADFEDAMAIHFFAPLRLTLEALPLMPRPGGRIVTIASIGGLVAIPHLVPYCASKFAEVGLSDGLRAELAREGIRVTTVCPGLMRTGSHLNAWFKGRHRPEFTLFTLIDSSPLTSIDSARAARRIVAACRRGQPFLVLSPQARLLWLAAALAPNATAEAMALAARFLPPPDGDSGDERRRGRDSTTALAPSILTWMADRAAVRNNEIPRPHVNGR
jgi:NAD(P)-dependent dehydrogenase (short-subunit alcohol dehydrogenase family)